MALFKLIEVSNKTKLDTIAITPGQYYVLDDGTMYYDNTLNNRVVLSPDMSDFLTNELADNLVTDIQISTSDDSVFKISVTKVGTEDDADATTEDFIFKSNLIEGSYDDSTKTLTMDVKTTADVIAGDNLPITSGAVYTAITELEEAIDEKIETAKESATAAVTVLNVTTNATDTDALATIANPKQGDFAICKHVINGDLAEYTAYVYDTTNGWCAMDGNYSAENVFIPDDLTLAGNFTSVGNYSKGDTINAGTSLQSILSSMLQQELYPGVDGTVSKPTATISASGSNGEVGTTFTPPTATLKITSVGSYPYAPTATGITFAVGDVTLAEAASSSAIESATNKTTNTTVMAANSTITLKASTTQGTYTDSAQSFKFSGTATYTDGVVPKTNLGNDYEEAQIKSATLTPTTATATFTGWRYIFAGGTTASTIDSAVIRALGSKVFKSNTSVQTSYSESAGVFTADLGATQVIFAYPSTYTTKTPQFQMFGLSWGDFTGFEAMETTVNVEGANGSTEVAYKVYVYTPAGPLEAESTKFRVKFA